MTHDHPLFDTVELLLCVGMRFTHTDTLPMFSFFDLRSSKPLSLCCQSCSIELYTHAPMHTRYKHERTKPKHRKTME